MLFINSLLFIRAGSPRPSAVQQGGGCVCVCLLSERCALSVPQGLYNLTRGTEEVASPGQGPAGLGEWK